MRRYRGWFACWALLVLAAPLCCCWGVNDTSKAAAEPVHACCASEDDAPTAPAPAEHECACHEKDQLASAEAAPQAPAAPDAMPVLMLWRDVTAAAPRARDFARQADGVSIHAPPGDPQALLCIYRC